MWLNIGISTNRLTEVLLKSLLQLKNVITSLAHKSKVGSLIMKDVVHVSLPAMAGDRLLLSFVISDPTLSKMMKNFF